MNMPISIEIVDDRDGVETDITRVFEYFRSVDERFSFFKETSEVSAINTGRLDPSEASSDMQEILRLSEETKKETNGYFDVYRENGSFNPSGLVKGWAIQKAADLLWREGYQNFYIEAGGDIQISGSNAERRAWKIGIRDPLHAPFQDTIKIVYLGNKKGIATSGTYLRGQHIYDPHTPGRTFGDVVSISVIGPTVYDADRFATAAFAMGRDGIGFIERLTGYEGYAVDSTGMALATSGFASYTIDTSDNT